jgi:hypothetical protein
MARMPKMTHMKIFLAGGTLTAVWILFILFCPTSASVFEVPFLPNNIAGKHFYTNRERCCV